MTLKRQYRMENGRLKYYVDTQLNIDDGILLDLLSQATSRHMRQVVSTIQAEQSAAIRYKNARVLCVVGGAGSGKTSIAMHRAAFLMYRQRDHARRPPHTDPFPRQRLFGVHIRRAARSRRREHTFAYLAGGRRGHSRQKGRIAAQADGKAARTARRDAPELRALQERQGVFAGIAQVRRIVCHLWPQFCQRMAGRQAPHPPRGTAAQCTRTSSNCSPPAQRLERVRATLETRMASWESSLYKQYEKQFEGHYQGPRTDLCQQNGRLPAPPARARPAALHAGDQGGSACSPKSCATPPASCATSTGKTAKPALHGGRTPWLRRG